MAQLFEYIKMAVSNIRMNKGRSILTMLGIIIGISSVITIISIGNGAKKSISDELNAMAGGQINIYSNTNSEAGIVNITEEDMEVIKSEIENISAISPQYNIWGGIQTPKGTFDTVITIGNSDLQFITNPTMLHGRYFSNEDFELGRSVAVVKQSSAKKMYGTDDVVGLTFELTEGTSTSDVTIIGVTKTNEGMLTGEYDSGYLGLEMPYSVFPDYAEGGFDTIYAVVDGGNSIETASKCITILENRHQVQGKDAFLQMDFESEMSQVTNVLNIITVLIVFVAAISLLVGGIGVMNIMLVSVTERTREIGIRKALGARTKSVMMQFLAESAIITGIGGAIGIIIGIAFAYLICLIPMVTFSPAISVQAVIIATLFSCSVGLFFGIYPARKAAKLSPIEALRRE